MPSGPKGRWEVNASIVSHGLPIEPTCRIVSVSGSGFYLWKRRKSSARSGRLEMIAEVIRQVQPECRHRHGARRVRAHADYI